jgi:hypothetical protein
VAIDNSNAIYFFDLAIIALKVGQNDLAKQTFADIQTMDHTDFIKLLSHYYLGRVLAAEGDLTKANAEFDVVLASPKIDKRLKEAITISKIRIKILGSLPFDPLSVPIMLQVGDMFYYF